MGRMLAPGKGMLPSLPLGPWLKSTPDDVVEHIIKLARKGLTPSSIGVTLRDSHSIPRVRFVTGNKILRVLKSNGGRWAQAPRGQPQGQDSKFRLILIESRIHRRAQYYKTKQQIPPTFKYDSATASTLIA
ncbi:hypothetical protein FIBSPDRAFT_1047946 [Athelia psychrophila]|uniref:Small ribosomal subunit protein uS15 N-terminal domain-containing protein n=1 Tax=Athelia psychrophila TaxID=1759441 RepID=A0A166EG75_9AGAM|nr:hypothetical protein FIBSPDRAFT_1047946 [Fibularhizoctonia sp. CBS 109695]